MQEQRSFTRVPFASSVLIMADGQRLHGESENLSLYGLYVRLDNNPAANANVEVIIPLRHEPNETYIGVNGIVARQSETGIGIKFHKIEVDDFINIKRIVCSKSGDESKIVDEFLNYIFYKDL
jgi:hypothetical protein